MTLPDGVHWHATAERGSRWPVDRNQWVAIGDEDDLEHLRQENCLIASRGDSIHTDIYSPAERHALYVEAVTDEQCTYGCSDQEPDRA